MLAEKYPQEAAATTYTEMLNSSNIWLLLLMSLARPRPLMADIHHTNKNVFIKVHFIKPMYLFRFSFLYNALPFFSSLTMCHDCDVLGVERINGISKHFGGDFFFFYLFGPGTNETCWSSWPPLSGYLTSLTLFSFVLECRGAAFSWSFP